MAKDPVLNDNIVQILTDLYGHLEDCEYHHYDDADDMHKAKKAVLDLLDKMIKRRNHGFHT